MLSALMMGKHMH